jgi:hypothetical protein
MSKKISSAERNYPTHDRECLGIVSAYREWRCYLEGVPSTCYTHHKPLIQLQTQPQISRRQARWLEFLDSFRPNVVYVQGRYNPADVLSRPPHVSNPTSPDGGQGSTGHPSTGSPALLPTLVALAKEGSRTFPIGYPRSNSANPVLHRRAAADSRGAARLATTDPILGSVPLSNQISTHHSCRPTRLVASVTETLLCSVNPVTYHPVLPMLTGA